MDWILVTWREATENDTPYLDEYPIVLTCPLPDDGQEILISDHGYVCTDICQFDGLGYWLEGKGDWLDIDAWMPLPEPYDSEQHDSCEWKWKGFWKTACGHFLLNSYDDCPFCRKKVKGM